MAKATPIIGMTLTMDDGTVVNVFEGDIIRGLTHKVNGELVTIDECAVRVIGATTKAQSAGPQGCPPEPYLAAYIIPTMIVADSSDENKAILDRIDIANIVRVGEVLDPDAAAGAIIIGPGDQYKPLADVIEEAEAGATIKLMPGTYDAPVNVTKDLTIIGDKTGATFLTGKITAGAPKARAAEGGVVESVKVSLADLNLTGDSLITLEPGVSSFEMRGCTFGGHNIVKTGSSNVMPIHVKTQAPILMKVVGNKFIDEPVDGYNLFELDCFLKNGSVFDGNTFTLNSCSHNLINIYGIDDGANVRVVNNVAYKLGLVRVGPKGDPKGTILMENNTYDCDIPEDMKKYAVLFLVQPYGAASDTMKNLTIICNKTTKPAAATYVGYLWMTSTSMQFTKDTVPTVVIDGKEVVFPEVMTPNTVIPCM